MGAVRRVARLELELARRLGDLLEDELGVEADAVLVLDDLAGGAQQLDRLGQQELDPELGDDPPPAAVEHVHRVLAEDLVARHRVDEHGWLLAVVGRSGLTWRLWAVIYTAWNNSSKQLRDARAPRPIDRGADLLVRVLESEQPVALTELASAAGLPKSTASRLVSALERRGLVEQDGERGRLRARARRSCASPSAACSSATSSSWRARRSTRSRRPAARRSTSRFPAPRRRRAPRAGRQPPLPRRRAVARALGRLPLHRRRQGVPGVRARAGPAGAAHAAHAPATITDAATRRRARAGPARRLRDRDRRARGRARRDRGAGARRARRGGRRAQHLRADAADDPGANRRAATGSDSEAAQARAAASDTPTSKENTPHDPRGDPAAALRRDARRQRAGGAAGRRGRARNRDSSPSGCSTTR